MPTLSINKLKVAIDNKPILRGVDLHIKQGETHAIMGPNGSGKSTLAQAILRHPRYKITGGSIHFAGKNLNRLTTDKVACLGVLLAFQYPSAIPGVSVNNLLKIAQGAGHKAGKKRNLKMFLGDIKSAASAMRLPEEFLSRSLNEGFSGGEKKKTEILQLAMLAPKLMILDETDSGLDVDALRIVARQINKLKAAGTSIMLITHYNRILKYVVPDNVHIMRQGRIVRSGGRKLAGEIEKNGYEPFS